MADAAGGGGVGGGGVSGGGWVGGRTDGVAQVLLISILGSVWHSGTEEEASCGCLS